MQNFESRQVFFFFYIYQALILNMFTVTNHGICPASTAVNMLMHDDVIKWKHFPLYWPFVRGIHR